MKIFDQKGGYWPTPQQELLLKAALLQGAESILSWDKWIDGINLQAIDFGSQRLLPLLMMNLGAQGVSHPAIAKFKGIYRLSWYRNQMLFNEIAPIIRSLQDAGIETMILKGAALVVDYYKNPGLRPMDDFDLLVPTLKIRLAIAQFGKLMGNPVKKLENLNDTNIIYQRAFHFVNQSGNQLDLHRHILFGTLEEDADQDFWEAAIPTRLGDTPTLTLNPTDQLLHTLVHGLSWNEVHSLRWVADALVILRTAPTIDWNRLIFQSKKREVLLTVSEGLQYLSDRLHAPIPPDILDRVQSISISPGDRMQYRIFSRSHGLPGILLRHWYTYTMYFAGASSWLRRLWGFPSFLKHFWKLSYLVQVPIVAGIKSIELLGDWWKRTFPSKKRP